MGERKKSVLEATKGEPAFGSLLSLKKSKSELLSVLGFACILFMTNDIHLYLFLESSASKEEF